MDSNVLYIYGKQFDSENNKYELAGKLISQYVKDKELVNDVNEQEAREVLDEFNDKFSPEKLKLLTAENVLDTIYSTTKNGNDNLCYFLEFYNKCKFNFGSISGGSAYKYGLFMKTDSGQWVTGSAQKSQLISEEEAVKIALKTRDELVNGATIISKSELKTVEDYEKLDDELSKITNGHCDLGWMHKYFCMAFPDKFATWHSQVWQKHILCALKIRPSDKFYGKCGQLNIIRRYAEINNQLFGNAVYKIVGDIIHFWRIGTTDSDGQRKCAAELVNDGAVGIGWNKIGDLQNYVIKNSINRNNINNKLIKEYYNKDNQLKVSSKKAGEICNFYNTDAGSVFVAMEGEKLLGIVDNIGDYYYDPSKLLGHRKSGTWHTCFEENQKLPSQNEGHLTTISEISRIDNLMFLYDKYYYGLKNTAPVKDNSEDSCSLIYNTTFETNYDWNRIIFGAPGTGKSYRLKEDAKQLLKNDNVAMERVTFHPEYTYSQFVGAYKPTTNNNNEIKYEFVPGPFMRVYVEALKSAQSSNPKPHLLLIEEINRAKVASVFGDVFQLLDRNEDGVSEYDIVASEDIRKYLSKEIGGSIKAFHKIQIPNNMFIWASMNSADQGVYPMDTAFKRRWNFEYIGIDENDSEITGHINLGKGENEVEVDLNVLRKAINQKLSNDFKVNEDKLIGPFFLSKSVLKTNDDNKLSNPDKFIKSFKNKVIMYLYEDAAKQFKQRFFSGCDSSRYSSVCDAFDDIGIKIFGEDFKENFYDIQKGQ